MRVQGREQGVAHNDTGVDDGWPEVVRWVIGIDPDVDNSGLAVIDAVGREVVEATSIPFWAVIDTIEAMTIGRPEFVVVIEGGWLNKGNWHLPPRCSGAMAAAIGRSTGRNHQTGILLEQGCRSRGWSVVVIEPLPLKMKKSNIWQSASGKISAEEILGLTGWNAPTNQEARDAILLAWHWSGFIHL